MLMFISFVLFLWLLILLAEPNKSWRLIGGILIFFACQVLYYGLPFKMDEAMIQTAKFDMALDKGYFQLLDEDAQALKDILVQAKRRHSRSLKSWSEDDVSLSLISPVHGYGGHIYILGPKAYYQMGDKYYKLHLTSDEIQTFYDVRDHYARVARTSVSIEGLRFETQVIAQEADYNLYSLIVWQPEDVVIDHVVIQRTTSHGTSSNTLQGQPLTRVFKDEFYINSQEAYGKVHMIIRGKRLVEGVMTLFQVDELLEP